MSTNSISSKTVSLSIIIPFRSFKNPYENIKHHGDIKHLGSNCTLNILLSPLLQFLYVQSLNLNYLVLNRVVILSTQYLTPSLPSYISLTLFLNALNPQLFHKPLLPCVLFPYVPSLFISLIHPMSRNTFTTLITSFSCDPFNTHTLSMVQHESEP